MTVRSATSAVSPVPRAVGGDRVASGHSVQFYDQDTFLLEDLSSFIGATLGAGDAGIVIATQAHREELAQRLQACGLDLARAVTQGRYVAIDALETTAKLLSDGRLDPDRFATVIGNLIERIRTTPTGKQRRVAIFGEMVALLWAQGQADTALHLEGLWNDLAATHAFSLHCAYPLQLFGQAADVAPLETLCAAHTRVLPAESYTTLRTEEERLRAVMLLQHKAQALQTELAAHRRTQECLRERNEALQAALAAREEFMLVAAHELKTPVTCVWGTVQVLLRKRQQDTLAPERLDAALQLLDAQTRKLTLLMARLLDAAQIEAGTLRIDLGRTDLAALVRATVTLHPGGATHILTCAGPAHLEAMIDPLRFEQVVINLLDNAVKFSPPGSSVRVDVGHDDAGGIRLSVTDQGRGIPPDQRTAVFARCHQVHHERHGTGMGLGLHVVREIVALHGGTVRIEEPEHPGTRVVMTLPPL